MIAVGADIGGSFIKTGLVEQESGRILDRRSAPFPRGLGVQAVWDTLAGSVEALLLDNGLSAGCLCSLGVAVPGSLNPQKTRVIHAYNLDFHDTEIRQPLQEKFPAVPLEILNDADAATLAEHRFGALRGTGTAVLLTLGTGVGGGLILGGRLFGGGRGNGVEIGHMTLRYDGEVHDCGNRGCVEMYCAQDALLIPEDPQSTPAGTIELIRRNDPSAQAVFERYTDALSGAIASLANLLDPEVIALGGGIAYAGAPLLEALSRKVKEKSFFKISYPIVQAALGNDAGIVGAAVAHLYL